MVALGLQRACRSHLDGLAWRLNWALVQRALTQLRKTLQDQTLLVPQEVLVPNRSMSSSGCAWRDVWLEHAGLDRVPAIVLRLPGTAARNTYRSPGICCTIYIEHPPLFFFSLFLITFSFSDIPAGGRPHGFTEKTCHPAVCGPCACP